LLISQLDQPGEVRNDVMLHECLTYQLKLTFLMKKKISK